ncbi:hypothetical protein [Nonomuraea sp. NPDC049400]|uniref:2OG-Fe(II)-dependent halogenase WelO5 family protein n=1 Tax=Nonomuraea sp. NPDC049400 TaxID=3364352 RepID=UPI0037A8763F
MPFEQEAFPVLVCDLLDGKDLQRLADCEVAGVHIRGALSPEMCAVVCAAVARQRFDDYDIERYRLPAARLGPSLNEARENGGIDAGYWRRSEDALGFWRGDPDCERVRSSCADLLRQAWPGDIGPARAGGRPLYWGIVRELSHGAVVHCDDVVFEYGRALFEQPPVVQLGFNLFIAAPRAGGETVIWQKRRSPADERHRVGVGYDPAVVAECPSAVIKPNAGDVVIFDSRNLHAVRPGDGRRITVSFFVGITDNGDLILWS